MIEKLDNNEQVLLMYLADELGAEDRLEVEQMLAVDANLRGELHELDECQRMLNDGMGRLDEASPLAAESAAVRRASREIRRRLAPPAVAPYAEPALEPQRRSLWWAYPAAAAAVVVLAAAIWMPRQHTPAPPQVVHGFEPFPGDVARYGYGRMARLFRDSWEQPGDLDDIDAAVDDEPAASPTVVASNAHDPHKDAAAPVDPLNQLLLSADASD